MVLSSFRNFSIVLFTLATVVGSACPASAQNDPAAQFSPVLNPAPAIGGTWSYGYENFPLPNPFNLAPVPVSVPVIDAWLPATGLDVGVFHNGTAANQTYSLGGDHATYVPGEIGMHPGPNDQYGIVEFTAATPGYYAIQGVFQGLDSSGLTDTDVRLLENNLTVVSGTVIGDGPGSDVPLSAGPFFLNVGDTLAYAVGGSPAWGSTGLVPGSASVDAVAVPEPSSLVLLGLAVISFATYRLRRRLV